LWTPIFVSPLVVYWSTISVLGLSFNVEAVCQPRGFSSWRLSDRTNVNPSAFLLAELSSQHGLPALWGGRVSVIYPFSRDQTPDCRPSHAALQLPYLLSPFRILFCFTRPEQRWHATVV